MQSPIVCLCLPPQWPCSFQKACRCLPVSSPTSLKGKVEDWYWGRFISARLVPLESLLSVSGRHRRDAGSPQTPATWNWPGGVILIPCLPLNQRFSAKMRDDDCVLARRRVSRPSTALTCRRSEILFLLIASCFVLLMSRCATALHHGRSFFFLFPTFFLQCCSIHLLQTYNLPSAVCPHLTFAVPLQVWSLVLSKEQ